MPNNPNNYCPICRKRSGIIQPRDNSWEQGHQPYKEYKCSTCGNGWTVRRHIKPVTPNQ